MQYVYFMELRGQRLALLKTDRLVSSPKELFRMVVADPVNFQRVYDQSTPSDVTQVLLTGDVFEFLLCGDIHVFRKWLRSEILNSNFQCFRLT